MAIGTFAMIACALLHLFTFQMRYALATTAVGFLLAICLVVLLLRGCESDVSREAISSTSTDASPDDPASDNQASAEATVPTAAEHGQLDGNSEAVLKPAPIKSSPPAVREDAKPSAGTTSPSDGLASATAKAADADRAASTDPGKAFRLYADAYAAASADASNPNSAAFAESLKAKLRKAANAANASAGSTNGRTLIER